MKIAYLLGSLNRGGMETLLLDVFKNADKTDFDFIGIHRKNGALKENFYASKQKFIQLSPKFKFDIFYLFKLRKLLKKEKIQIAHAQQWLDALYAKIATIGTKIKVVQTYHGFEKDNFLLRFIIKKTDINFFVSDYQKGFYIKKYNLKPEKQAVVYNGISFEKFNNSGHSELSEESYEQNRFLANARNDGQLKMAMVGNFVRGRSQIEICKFLKLLNQQNIDFDFYFIGKKNEVETWRFDDCVNFCKENQLENYVHFLGSRNDVPAILKQLDTFIYSTDHDTFGIAVIEAIAAKIPVFVNDWAVMQEVTENGKFATIYKTKDENDLLQKFLIFLQNKNEFIKNAEKSSIAVQNKFSIENHLNNLKQEYSKLLTLNS